jgi:hypothetical protein
MDSSILNKTFLQYKQEYAVVIYAYGEIITYGSRAFGAVFALLNVAIFMHKAILNSSETFYYLLAISVADFVYMSLLVTANLTFKICNTSSTQCSLFGQYLAFFLYISVSNCISSSLAIFNIILENFLALQRLHLIKNKPFLPKVRPIHVIPTVLVFSLLYYLPTAFTSEIVTRTIFLNDSNVTEYKMVNTKYGNSFIGLATPAILSFGRLTLSGPVLLSLTIYNIYIFKKYLKKKRAVSTRKTISKESRSSTAFNDNLTIMLILIALVYTFGNMPYMIYYSITEIAPSFQKDVMSVLNWFSRLCLSLLVIFKVPVYFSYNKLYKRQLLQYLCVLSRPKSSRKSSMSLSQRAMSPTAKSTVPVMIQVRDQ